MYYTKIFRFSGVTIAGALRLREASAFSHDGHRTTCLKQPNSGC